MIVLVCGGRQYSDDHGHLAAVLDNIHKAKPIRVIVEGGATGADRAGRRWAERYGIHVATVLPQWDRYGNAAGPLRNAAMLALKPDIVVACPGGRGTASMVGLAKEAGVPVHTVQRQGTGENLKT